MKKLHKHTLDRLSFRDYIMAYGKIEKGLGRIYRYGTSYKAPGSTGWERQQARRENREWARMFRRQARLDSKRILNDEIERFYNEKE